MFRRRRLLPKVPIYGFIGGIPESFGGRTGVCLQRADAFAELDKRNVEILTLSPRHGIDPAALTQRLREEGRIGKRVSIRNVWADLRGVSEAELWRLGGTARVDIGLNRDELLPYAGVPGVQRKSESGTLLQTDRFRDDGTRVMSYRRDSLETGVLSKSVVTLFSRDGQVIAQWPEQYLLYFAWMDWVIGSDPAVIISDAPRTAAWIHNYRRDNIVFVTTIHSKHSSHPASPKGTLGITYLPTLKHMDYFDRVAILTQAQHDDLRLMGIGSDNMVVLPNMVGAQPIKRVLPRAKGSGLMLARLSHQKRIDHAIRAVEVARQSNAAVVLDVYGVSGDAEESLEGLIGQLSLGGHVALRGYDPRAKSRFEQASFSLVTSQYEGQPLVLLESMAAGCLPIAYDIEYGPSDIITDGVDGFLVQAGDVDALGRKIAELASMSEADLTRMRQAAVQRSQDFSPEKITRRWGAALAIALSEKTPVKKVGGRASLVAGTADGSCLRLSVKLTGGASKFPAWAMVVWTEQKGRGYGRVPAQIVSHGEATHIEATVPAELLNARKTLDFWVDVRVGGNPERLRIKDARQTITEQPGCVNLFATKYGSLSANPVKP